MCYTNNVERDNKQKEANNNEGTCQEDDEGNEHDRDG